MKDMDGNGMIRYSRPPNAPHSRTAVWPLNAMLRFDLKPGSTSLHPLADHIQHTALWGKQGSRCYVKEVCNAAAVPH